MARFSVYVDGKHKGIYRASDRKWAIRKLLEAQRFDSLHDVAKFTGKTVEEVLARFEVINVDEIAIDEAKFTARWVKERKWVEDRHYNAMRSGHYTEWVVFGDVKIGKFIGQWKAVDRSSTDTCEGVTTLRYVSAQSYDYMPSSEAYPADNSPEMDAIGKEVINRHAEDLRDLARGCVDVMYEDRRYYNEGVHHKLQRKILRKENRRRESLLYFK